MFGKWMNNYYYGKSGKGDYTKEDLPRTRGKLFGEMLRVRFPALFRLNGLAVLFFLPMMYVLVRMAGSLYNLMSIVMQVGEDTAAAAPDLVEIYNNRAQAAFGVMFTSMLWLIPAIAVTGPVQAGMAYVTRNWARDEHAFVFSDFKDAVKNNWKQALAVSSITGFVPFLVLVCWQFYGQMARGNAFFMAPRVLTLALGLMWMLSLTYMYPMMVTYDMKLGQVVRNSFLLAVGRLPHTALIRLAMLVPAVIVGLVTMYTPYGLYALMALAGYYLLLGNALARFVYASFTNAMFDKYINSRIEGVKLNRGLAEIEDDDENDDDADGERE